MLKKSFVLIVTLAAALALPSCNKEIEYNSNTGHDGSRDSATQLLVNTNKVDDISAPTGDNEDWYYFVPQEKGFITVSTFIDKPKDIVLDMTVMDGFGRTLHTLKSNTGDNVYTFAEFPVEPERYFISLITKEGASSYTLRADFRLPDPEPECEIGTFACVGSVLKECQKTGYVDVKVCEGDTPQCDSLNGECLPPDKKPSGHKKCKAGQPGCKTAETAPVEDASDEFETAKTIKGTIVLVTPRGGDLVDVKINGLGSSKGIKKGAKARLRGLKRHVDIYDCKTTFCQATIKATSDELSHYDTVEVIVP